MNDEPIDIGKPIDFRWMDKHNHLSAKYGDESDRAAALLAASFLEEQTKEALLSILVEDERVISSLFSGYGPLSTFSAYIDVMYALGHIPRELCTELHLIRKIRNHFAHYPDITDFNTQKVKDWCRELSTATRFLEDKNTELDARTRFLCAVANCVADVRMRLQAVPRPTVPCAKALIFQYGSNCLESQINGEDRLCGDAKFAGIAQTVEDYQLAFDVLSKNRGCAASDIVRCPGSKVWGVLYEVPEFLVMRKTAKERNRKSLDQIEGEGTNYERRSIDVKCPNGDVHTAITYTVITPRKDVRTNLEYVRHIVNGLREHGIPEDYIANVKAIACANNPDIAADVGVL